jgi:hypothetical protein
MNAITRSIDALGSAKSSDKRSSALIRVLESGLRVPTRIWARFDMVVVCCLTDAVPTFNISPQQSQKGRWLIYKGFRMIHRRDAKMSKRNSHTLLENGIVTITTTPQVAPVNMGIQQSSAQGLRNGLLLPTLGPCASTFSSSGFRAVVASYPGAFSR